jgi:RHS repeat-associated protein
VAELYNGSAYAEILYSPVGKTAIMTIMNGVTTLAKAFVGLPGGGTAVYTSTGLAYYRHADWLGSSRLASTQARGLYSSTAYSPFGEQYATAGTADASFTGQNSDTDPSLYDFAARRLSPSQGRWISPAPAGLAAVDPTNPQTWNRYAYVANNPLNATDPTGLYRSAFNGCDSEQYNCAGGAGNGDEGENLGPDDGNFIDASGQVYGNDLPNPSIQGVNMPTNWGPGSIMQATSNQAFIQDQLNQYLAYVTSMFDTLNNPAGNNLQCGGSNGDDGTDDGDGGANDGDDSADFLSNSLTHSRRSMRLRPFASGPSSSKNGSNSCKAPNKNTNNYGGYVFPTKDACGNNIYDSNGVVQPSSCPMGHPTKEQTCHLFAVVGAAASLLIPGVDVGAVASWGIWGTGAAAGAAGLTYCW